MKKEDVIEGRDAGINTSRMRKKKIRDRKCAKNESREGNYKPGKMKGKGENMVQQRSYEEQICA